MRRLLVSSLLIAGMALGGVTGVHATGDYENKQDSMQKNDMTQPETRSENFSGEGQEYTVQEGDTLASIAEEHLGSADQWQVIARANNIENPDQLEVGQTLTIPASGERSDASAPAFSNDTAQPDISQQNDAAMSSASESAQTPEETARDEAGDVTRPNSDSYNTQHENETVTNKSDSSFESDANSDVTAENDSSMKEEQEIKGEITEIGSGNESVILKDEAGMTHTLKLDNQEVLEGIAVGDFVKAELEGGTVISLEKVDRSA